MSSTRDIKNCCLYTNDGSILLNCVIDDKKYTFLLTGRVERVKLHQFSQIEECEKNHSVSGGIFCEFQYDTRYFDKPAYHPCVEVCVDLKDAAGYVIIFGMKIVSYKEITHTEDKCFPFRCFHE
jgi:hypothetical protein